MQNGGGRKKEDKATIAQMGEDEVEWNGMECSITYLMRAPPLEVERRNAQSIPTLP